MAPGDTPEIVHFESGEELEAWLDANGTEADELWIEIHKKHTGVKSLTWAEIVDAALCFGWIDSQSRSIDEDRYRQRLTPRRKRSKWSKVNREKVEALVKSGRMRESGLAEVDRAKADGRWGAAYDGSATATVPDDLAKALKVRKLEKAYAALDSQNRYAILHRIQTVKRAETRARHIEKTCEMLEKGEKHHP
ncbi:MAG: YdeI/OmpD-associated family protein [Solirubrobacterales bacterium]